MLLSRQSCIKYHYLTSLPKKLLDIVLPSVVLDRNIKEMKVRFLHRNYKVWALFQKVVFSIFNSSFSCNVLGSLGYDF